MSKQKPGLGSTTARLASPRGDCGRGVERKKFVRKFRRAKRDRRDFARMRPCRLSEEEKEEEDNGRRRNQFSKDETAASVERDEPVRATAGRQERVGV